MDSMEDYLLYNRCKVCGRFIDESIYDDNCGLCDDCFIERTTWMDSPFGGDYDV